MLVRFWGTRGSLPAPLSAADVRKKIVSALAESVGHDLTTPVMVNRFIDNQLGFDVSGTYGGNTSCIEIDGVGPDYVLCDLGTGIRAFGQNLMTTPRQGRNNTFHVFMSHVHWDHIMGFPFLVQSYIPGNKIKIYSCDEGTEEAFRRQHGAPSFPVDFDMLGSDIEFIQLNPGDNYEVNGLQVTPFIQYHGGDSFGYRFEGDGKTVVYSTDCEHKQDQLKQDYPFIEHFQDADVLVFDAMYSLAEAISIKEDWGHSSNIVGVELALMANVKQLYLFHHEPANNDTALVQILADTRRYVELIAEDGQFVDVHSAYDGLEVQL